MFMSDDAFKNGQSAGRPPRVDAERVAGQPLHRIAEVRRTQCVSTRAAQQFLGLCSREFRRQEDENSDLLLSELYQWQRLLAVPVSELLVEPQMELSRSISYRAALVKVMKTANTILEQARQPNIRALAMRLSEQLVEIMPELADVSPWPAVGQRRTREEWGRIVERPFSSSSIDFPRDRDGD
ncbi:MAG: hypothetical protein HYX69_21440 [Planctomycetia bacterium]|nr:hypothetical protein [Planctomycetia bacterium]